MTSSKALFFCFVVALTLLELVVSDPNPAYVCSFCAITLGLVEQAAFQVKLQDFLLPKCNGGSACEFAVKKLIASLEAKVAPDSICKSLSLCPG
jgi:hypothetical protein